MTAIATLILLLSKFMEGAWIVVVAIPLFILLFHRIEVYYTRAAQDSGIGVIPPPPDGKRTLVVVPVTDVSRLTQHAISVAISLGDEVMAVTVVFDDEPVGLPKTDVDASGGNGTRGSSCRYCTPATPLSCSPSWRWLTNSAPTRSGGFTAYDEAATRAQLDQWVVGWRIPRVKVKVG